MRWLVRLISAVLRRYAPFAAHEKLNIKGQVVVRVYDRAGNLLWEEVGENLIVNQGKQYLLANILNENTRYNGAYLCISSSSTAPTADETTVPNLISAKTATKTKQISTTPYYAQWAATWGTDEANGTTINSVAIAESSTGSGEWSRYVLSTPINKTSDIAVEIQYRYEL